MQFARVRTGARRTLAAWVLMLAVPACTGQVSAPQDEGAGGDGGDAEGGESGGGGTSRGGAAGTPSAAACGKSIRPGPSPMRRLNRFEYNNTVQELLGDSSRPADAFPPEEIGNGFGNDASALGVSRLLAEKYFDAAKALAARATADATKLAQLLGCDPSKGEDACARSFLDRFGLRAFRRPLDDGEKERLFAVYQAGRMGADFKGGVQAAITAMLQMPQFLYRVELGTPVAGTTGVSKLGHYEMASRLSYMLWGGMPDGALFDAAKAGKLGTREEIRAQAERMLGDKRAREVVRFFHGQLFGLFGLDRLMKSKESFPKFFPELGPSLREEAERFIEAVTWQGPGTYKEMFTAPYSFMNAALAGFYGLNGPKGTAFEKVSLDPKRHAGFLTSGGIMAALTPGTQTNPVLRGAYVRNKLFCDPPPDPPASLMVAEPKPDPTLTTRERFSAHQTEASCKGCHKLLDPIGFGFERYDGLGVWRDQDNGKDVDTRGRIDGTDVEGDFDGAIELMGKLAGSKQVGQCLSAHWMTFGYGRGFDEEQDVCNRASLEAAFAKSGGKVTDLILALTQTDAFLYRPAVNP